MHEFLVLHSPEHDSRCHAHDTGECPYLCLGAKQWQLLRVFGRHQRVGSEAVCLRFFVVIEPVEPFNEQQFFSRVSPGEPLHGRS